MVDAAKLEEACTAIRSMGLALIVWVPDDVESVSKLKGEAASDWLVENRKYIEDRCCEVGWGVIDVLLDPDQRQDDAE